MSSLLDDVSRIIASPVSRRKLLGLVGGAVGGAVLASLGLDKTAAAFGGGDEPKCSKEQTFCNGKCCDKGESCCGGKCCGCGQECCNGVCCGPGSKCCNGKCCPGVVCNGKCCEQNEICCDGKCVPKTVSNHGRC